jgi:hypothetical protein
LSVEGRSQGKGIVRIRVKTHAENVPKVGSLSSFGTMKLGCFEPSVYVSFYATARAKPVLSMDDLGILLTQDDAKLKATPFPHKILSDRITGSM